MFDFLNVNRTLQKKLAEMDPETLHKTVNSIKQIMNTEEGQNLMQQLQDIDKEQILQKLKALDQKDVDQKLESIDLESISKQINKLDKNQMLKALNNNPDIMKELNKLFHKS